MRKERTVSMAFIMFMFFVFICISFIKISAIVVSSICGVRASMRVDICVCVWANVCMCTRESVRLVYESVWVYVYMEGGGERAPVYERETSVVAYVRVYVSELRVSSSLRTDRVNHSCT